MKDAKALGARKTIGDDGWTACCSKSCARIRPPTFEVCQLNEPNPSKQLNGSEGALSSV